MPVTVFGPCAGIKTNKLFGIAFSQSTSGPMALWNYTIPDASPILSYHPYADGFGLSNGWQTYYTVSGFNTQPGEGSEGVSSHLTMLPGAEVSLQFYGSAVYLYGTVNASYEVILDENVLLFEGATGVLYSNQNLIEESHSVTLKVNPANTTPLMAFTSATVTTSDQEIPTPVFHDNSDSALSYFGNWTSNTVQGIPNSSVTAPFHQTLNAGASVMMNFSSAVAIELYASTNFGHGLYSVSLDNEAPQIYNGSTFWLVTDTVVFVQAGLDPGRTHTLNVTNLSGGAKFTLSSVVTYEVDVSQTGPSQPSNSSTGPGGSQGASSHSGSVKVAEIVGPVVGVLILGLLSVVLWLRSRKPRPNDETSITPLVLPGPPSNRLGQTGVQPLRKGHLGSLPPTLPVSPTTQYTPASAVSPNTSPTDVNQIIELIAQRIDRRGGQGPEGALPPEYHVHSR
ncbi:hypothetical protein B0H12DRAFT_1134292 [Mycena haematopus]|nr:hypothetical protein B0H12DRAFT_1134292 [Mycena haematopus]